MPHGLNAPRIVDVPIIRDKRGAIAVLEPPTLGFPIGRTYFLFDVDEFAERGGHAHRSLHQCLIAAAGCFTVQLDDGLDLQKEVELNTPQQGLILPPGHWRRIHSFSSRAICLVLASDVYDESDYIRDHAEFLAWRAEHDSAR